MDFEKEMIINAFNTSIEEDCMVAYSNEELFDKDLEKSITARKSGNQCFAKKNHDEKLHEKIWKLYTRSIAFAPAESVELAAGFANRSAFLLHLKKYKEALLDVERALRITQSSVLKVKLFCRQAECFVALQEGKQSSSLEKAKYWWKKVEKDGEEAGERANLNKMIERAQQIIEENVLDCPEKEKKNDLICKNDAVDVCYGEKYGRGLIATRDIEPGELVYVEKMYVASVNKSKAHAYCSHCLAISWALIPCDHCAYYMYCSEKCKTKAWEKYHDIECSMKHIDLYKKYAQYYAELSIRSLIMGIKEVGSIKKLRKLINEIERCKDAKTKGFSKDEKFVSNSFRSLCSLQSSKNDKTIDAFSIISIALMQRLATCTDIFGKDFHNKGEDLRQLRQHKDVVFIACLLLRLMSTFSLNAFSVQRVSEDCDVTENPVHCLRNCCCSRGMSISLLTSLINHNCDNNVDKFYTNDGKVVYYATKPIKARSQIFSRYYFNYVAFSKNIRQKSLLNMFEFRCDCLACQEDWPNAKMLIENEANKLKHSIIDELTLSIMQKNRHLMMNLNSYNFSRKEIQSFAKDIAKVQAQKTQKPDLVTTSFHFALSAMMETRYFDMLKIPNSCYDK